jgi:hypothetical protein
MLHYVLQLLDRQNVCYGDKSLAPEIEVYLHTFLAVPLALKIYLKDKISSMGPYVKFPY